MDELLPSISDSGNEMNAGLIRTYLRVFWNNMSTAARLDAMTRLVETGEATQMEELAVVNRNVLHSMWSIFT